MEPRHGRRLGRLIIFLAVAAGLVSAVRAQSSLPAPAAVNVHYGDHPHQTLDLWRPENDSAPLVVYLHGGGFLSGDKAQVPPMLVNRLLRAGIAVASANYRLSTDAPYPAPMQDGARAIQFLRANAGEWGIDPKEICVVGGSAGGGIALWVAFHDDLADPTAADEVSLESSRVECAAGMGAQSTYDPNVAAGLIGKVLLEHRAIDPLFAIPRDQWDTDKARAVFADASPVNHLSRDDPPVFAAYDLANAPLDERLPLNHAAHHPRFGTYLREQAEKVGVRVTVKTLEDYRSADAMDRLWLDMVDFFRKHLRN